MCFLVKVPYVLVIGHVDNNNMIMILLFSSLPPHPLLEPSSLGTPGLSNCLLKGWFFSTLFNNMYDVLSFMLVTPMLAQVLGVCQGVISVNYIEV